MSESGQFVVDAVGLRKVFRDFWGRPKAIAVDGIDIQIKQGQVIGLLGPNGSGKSTTVKMLLGLLKPTGGSLKVFNRPCSDVQIKTRIGYLPEETYLYKYLTASETLDFFGALFNLPAKERQRRNKQLLEMVGLANSADRPVGEFSKGMARRVGLAQALINDPDLVILDEPTSGLDPIGCNEVKSLIRVLAERKKTVILCSHLLADVEDVCDTIYVMYGGKVRASGELGKLLTVEDKTRIITPTLSDDMLQRIMSILNELSQEDVKIDHPSMNLEDFFMEVVRSAKEESAPTAGADTGGIADYLTGDEADKERSTAMLEDLAKPAEPEPEPEPEAPAKPEPDHDRLADLSKSREADVESESESDDKAEADRDARNERLEGLMGKSDKD